MRIVGSISRSLLGVSQKGSNQDCHPERSVAENSPGRGWAARSRGTPRPHPEPSRLGVSFPDTVPVNPRVRIHHGGLRCVCKHLLSSFISGIVAGCASRCPSGENSLIRLGEDDLSGSLDSAPESLERDRSVWRCARDDKALLQRLRENLGQKRAQEPGGTTQAILTAAAPSEPISHTPSKSTKQQRTFSSGICERR